MRKLESSELIVNPDGSIYHLNLKPNQLAPTIITVGDPDRVELVTQHFEHVEFSLHCREFKSSTGHYRGKRITVISTGIGTDNVDIVLNELDALVNVDFNTRTIKEKLTSLDIIRIGTSGSIQEDIPVDHFLLSLKAIGLDGMAHAYDCKHIRDLDMETAFMEQTNWSADKARPYIINGDSDLEQLLSSKETVGGLTATFNGFYGAQARTIRLGLSDGDIHHKVRDFRFKDQRITNLEMETAGIYALAKLLGHRAMSMNAILANRPLGDFSQHPQRTIEKLIKYTLDKLSV